MVCHRRVSFDETGQAKARKPNSVHSGNSCIDIPVVHERSSELHALANHKGLAEITPTGLRATRCFAPNGVHVFRGMGQAALVRLSMVQRDPSPTLWRHFRCDGMEDARSCARPWPPLARVAILGRMRWAVRF